MSNQIQKTDEKQKNVRQLLLQSQAQIIKALPKAIDGQRMFRAYMTAIQLTPRLLDCDSMSLVAGVMQAAQFGLSLDPMMGEAYLVPRWSKKVKGHVATFQLGYKGLRKLAMQADPGLQDIFAQWVYDRDVFEYTLGDEPRIDRHIPSEEENPGELRLAYAVAVWKDGYKRRYVMLGRDIRKIRDNSDGYKKAKAEGWDSPWVSNEQEMWRKTALRALCGQMQLATEDPTLASALAMDDNVDAIPATGLTVTSVETNEPAPKNSKPEAPKDPLDAAADAAEQQDVASAVEKESGAATNQEPTPPKATRRRSKAS